MDKEYIYISTSSCMAVKCQQATRRPDLVSNAATFRSHPACVRADMYRSAREPAFRKANVLEIVSVIYFTSVLSSGARFSFADKRSTRAVSNACIQALSCVWVVLLVFRRILASQVWRL